MFLSEHTNCEACQLIFQRKPKVATDIHHTRGKIGRLLNMSEFFKAVCRECHDWITSHTLKARELGLVCQVGQWNTVPRVNND